MKARRSLNEALGFSPVKLPDCPNNSPSRNLTGTPRVTRDIAADLYNNIQKWNAWHIKGCRIVKQIASIKANSGATYSSHLEEAVNELYSIVQNIRVHWENLELLVNQTKALYQLHGNDKPVFLSLSAASIANLISDISTAYKKEFTMKEFILENIAHEKNKDNAMFLAACWTHQVNINDDITFKLEALLVETNHRPII
ncbi:cyclin-dependent kinase 2-interacting protein-like [Cylas formicarius]|uniref:cyclin-dependent kinase 2-interacting protein-like n=1 Tax=Cylas formicarius TaxID=197179 RepID=UPI002958696A|nr:cyclin-dependent kinase 2-interacting protein-like [Cylas formicarius]